MWVTHYDTLPAMYLCLHAEHQRNTSRAVAKVSVQGRVWVLLQWSTCKPASPRLACQTVSKVKLSHTSSLYICSCLLTHTVCSSRPHLQRLPASHAPLCALYGTLCSEHLREAHMVSITQPDIVAQSGHECCEAVLTLFEH